MGSKTLEKAKQHPGLATLIMLGSAAGAFVAIWTLIGVVDNAVISHAELSEIFVKHSGDTHTGTQQQIDSIRQQSQCGSIDIQIAILSDVIWRLEQTDPSGLRLVEKTEELQKLRDRRVALKCAQIA